MQKQHTWVQAVASWAFVVAIWARLLVGPQLWQPIVMTLAGLVQVIVVVHYRDSSGVSWWLVLVGSVGITLGALVLLIAAIT